MSLIRIWAVATNGFREVMRDRIFFVIAFYTLIMFAGWRLLPEIAGASQDKIIADLGSATASILGVVVAIFVGTGLINKEIEKRTVFVLVTKPITSAEFIIGKHRNGPRGNRSGVRAADPQGGAGRVAGIRDDNRHREQRRRDSRAGVGHDLQHPTVEPM